jgi:predicted enzyme related to lactoylglutathione lyase
MITRVTHFTLFVHNQDDALKFYAEKVGFKVHTDVMLQGFRWLTVHPVGQPDFEIALMPATSPEEAALIGKQAGQKPLLAMETNDCMKDFEILSAQGIKFVAQPKPEPWGMAAAFEDLYGNVIYLSQPVTQQAPQ